jgi:Flp pilus assembly pilin Flp
MRKALARLFSRDEGVTSVEYAVMLALLLAVMLAAIKVVGDNTRTSLQNSNSTLQTKGFGS